VLWGQCKQGIKIDDIDRRLYDGYLGAVDSVTSENQIARRVLDACSDALNEIMEKLVELNFGRGARGAAKISFSMSPAQSIQQTSPNSDPIAEGIVAYRRIRQLKRDALDPNLPKNKSLAAFDEFGPAQAEFEATWLKHTDPRIALFFNLWTRDFILDDAGLRLQGDDPHHGHTEQYRVRWNMAKRLGVLDLPPYPPRDLNRHELEDAYHRLQQSLRLAVVG